MKEERETAATSMSETKFEIINLLESTHRNGMAKLIDELIMKGFFESPASTRIHGSYAGGLAKHSLRVHELLDEFCGICDPGKATGSGQKPFELKPENIIIAPLLHDICKCGAYLGDEAPYKWNKAQPKGHATLSIARIKPFIKLDPVEELIIRYHMGLYGLNEFYEKGSWEFKTNAEYPLRGDHSKDDTMTKEESQNARRNKSLRNTYYHNPVCKLMYFADELATLEEKVEQ